MCPVVTARRRVSRRRSVAIFVALFAIAPVALLWASTPADRTVVIGINRDYPPYEYLDRLGRPAGFDVDLARAVAEVEGIRVEFRAGVWEDLVERFKRGQIDMLAGMLHSRERERFAAFSTPYLVVHYSIFVRTPEPVLADVGALRGKSVLVERGSQMHDFLRADSLGVHAVPVASEPEALRRLAAGEGDAAVVPQLEGLVLAKQRGLRVRQAGGPVLTRQLCFAVRPDDPELLSRLNTGLSVLYQTGRYATVYKRSFGEPLSEYGLGWLVPWVRGVLGVLMLALIGVAVWNRSLGRQVRIATRQLRAANAEILRRERFLDAVIENLPLGLFAKDAGRGLAYSLWNSRSEEMFGIPRQAALGKTDRELFPDELARTFLESDHAIVASRQPFEMIVERVLSRSQGVRTLHTRKVPLLDELGGVSLILGIAEDVTERDALQEQLREARRLEGLGVLAGGIAHDFNNLLAAILGNLGLATIRLPAGHPVLPLLRTIETTALRASDLTRQMLAYAGKAEVHVQPLDLNDAVAGMAALLEVSIPPGVTLTCRPAPGLPAVQADPTQLHQVILNLLTNAADAIGKAEGQIVVSTAVGEFTPSHHPRLHPASPPIAPGRYVTLSVSDTGEGMTEETRERVFDPFFTTKFAGHGLGLSAILGILKAHAAGIGIDSVPGTGTTFTLHFPALDAPAPAAQPAAEPAAIPAQGRGTVLLVEDVDTLRKTTAAMLVHLGFEVLQAADGEAALEIWTREHPRIRLVLTDLTMPGLSGLALAKAIRALQPDARIVLMSGFPNSGNEAGTATTDLSGFLPKPFRLADLGSAIDKALS